MTTVGELLSDAQKQYLEGIFGPITSGTRPHSHPVAAIERKLVETKCYETLCEMTASKIGQFTENKIARMAIIDIGGNPMRHDSASKHDPGRSCVFSNCPLLSPADITREQARRGYFGFTNALNTPTPSNPSYCNHKSQECHCYTPDNIRGYLSIHSIYYLTPDVIADIIAPSGTPLVAAFHRFPGRNGSLLYGEAAYTKEAGCVSMKVHGTLADYRHSDCEWLSLEHAVTKHGILTWHEKAHFGSTYVAVFTMAPKSFQLPKPMPFSTDALSSIDGNNCEFDVRYKRVGELMDFHSHLNEDFQISRLFHVAGSIYLETGTRTVALPIGLIYTVATNIAYTKITLDTFNNVSSQLRRNAAGLNLTAREKNDVILYGTPIVMMLNLERSSTTMLAVIGKRLESIKRYNSMLEMKYPYTIIPLKLILVLLWLSVSIGWWVLLAEEHWSGWNALWPFFILVVVFILLYPWRLHSLRWMRYMPSEARALYNKAINIIEAIDYKKWPRFNKVVIETPAPLSVPKENGIIRIDVDKDLPPLPVIAYYEGITIGGSIELPDPEPVIFDGRSGNNVAHGAVARLLARDTDDTDPDHPAYLVWEVARDTIPPVLYTFDPPVKRYPDANWLVTFPPARREVIIKDHNAWKVGGSQIDELAANCSIFVKTEKGSKLKPRNIIDYPPRYHMEFGPWSRAMTHRLAGDWHSKKNITLSIGMTAFELGKWHERNTELLFETEGPPLVTGGDGDSYEASITVGALAYRHHIYKEYGADERALAAHALQYKWKATSRSGVQVIKEGTTTSGVDDTLVGNSITNGDAHYRYFDNCVHQMRSEGATTKGFALLVCGDDIYIMLSRSLWGYMHNTLTGLQEHMVKHGLLFTYTDPSISDFENPCLADFCSGYFYHNSDGTTVWGLKIFRTLWKTYLPQPDQAKNNPSLLVKAIALSLRGAVDHLPILSNANKKAITSTKQLVDPAKKMFNHIASGYKGKVDLDFVARLYGTDITTLAAIATEIERGTLPFRIKHPFALKGLDIDMPIKPNTLESVIMPLMPSLATVASDAPSGLIKFGDFDGEPGSWAA